jgi:hypothetical protein
MCTPGLRRRTVRGRAAGLSETGVGLSAGQNPENVMTGKCSDLGREHNDGLSAGCTGLPSVRLQKINRDEQVLDSAQL